MAGLCHDLGWYSNENADSNIYFKIVFLFLVDLIGHGPFSHLFDQLFIPKTRPRFKWKVSRLYLLIIEQDNMNVAFELQLTSAQYC